MALNLTNVFTALGRIGNNAYLINNTQSVQNNPFDDLLALSYINPTWIASLSQSYDPAIRVESSGMSVWSSVAQVILQGMVSADNPGYGVDLGTSLRYLLEQMTNQSATVKACTITSNITADALNTGQPGVYVSITRYDGLIFQNTIAEISNFVFTNDSYTGTATQNQEPWQWIGAPNISSLGTGTTVGTWDWDWPQGSNSTTTGSNIDAAQDATAAGNYLTNGDMETWSGSPVKLDNWYLATGTWGTDVKRSSAAAGLNGGYALEYVAGTSVQSVLHQQFNSAISDPTDVTAGTDVALTQFKTYIVCLWIKRSGVVSAGVLRVAIVDSTATVINDQAGTPNSGTITLTGITTSYVAHFFEFRLPIVPPTNGIMRLELKMSTALAGANVLLDYIAFAQPTQLYPGGPSLISFANPAAPVEAGPNPDGWIVEFTNDRGSAVLGATLQTLASRLYQTPDLILPYSATPTLTDGLITSGQTFTPNVFNLSYPAEQTSSYEGPTVDANTFPYTFQVIQHIGVRDCTINGLMQESSDTFSWSQITGSDFTSVVANNNIQVKLITRTKRYIRYAADLLGGAPSAFMSVSGGY